MVDDRLVIRKKAERDDDSDEESEAEDDEYQGEGYEAQHKLRCQLLMQRLEPLNLKCLSHYNVI